MSGPGSSPARGPDGDGTGLSREQWRRILDGLESPTYNEVAHTIKDAYEVNERTAFDRIDGALKTEVLKEVDADGSFPDLQVIDAFNPSGTGVPDAPQTAYYWNLDYTDTVDGSYGEAAEWDAWMPTCDGKNGKLPYAKYHDHPAIDYHRPDDDDARTRKHPQFVWSDPSNWDTFNAVDRQVRMDPGSRLPRSSRSTKTSPIPTRTTRPLIPSYLLTATTW